MEDIFDLVKEVSRKNKAKKGFDGQKFWQPIKNISGSYDTHVKEWKAISKPLYAKIMALPE